MLFHAIPTVLRLRTLGTGTYIVFGCPWNCSEYLRIARSIGIAVIIGQHKCSKKCYKPSNKLNVFAFETADSWQTLNDLNNWLLFTHNLVANQLGLKHQHFAFAPSHLLSHIIFHMLDKPCEFARYAAHRTSDLAIISQLQTSLSLYIHMLCEPNLIRGRNNFFANNTPRTSGIFLRYIHD